MRMNKKEIEKSIKAASTLFKIKEEHGIEAARMASSLVDGILVNRLCVALIIEGGCEVEDLFSGAWERLTPQDWRKREKAMARAFSRIKSADFIGQGVDFQYLREIEK